MNLYEVTVDESRETRFYVRCESHAEARAQAKEIASIIDEDDWEKSPDRHVSVLTVSVHNPDSNVAVWSGGETGGWEPAGPEYDDENRWWVVVVTDRHGQMALSRRCDGDDGPFTGEWRLLTEREAHDLADVYNADPPPDGGGTATALEVFRYDGDPLWPEEQM